MAAVVEDSGRGAASKPAQPEPPGGADLLTLLRVGSRDRHPPPALFLHPSPQASHVSIPGIHASPPTAPSAAAAAAAAPSIVATGNPVRSTASLSREVNAPPSAQAPSANPNPRRAAAFKTPTIRDTPSISSVASAPLRTARSADRTDALWAEMQATLEEVQYSASGATHVFRAEHEKKLADLRTAQIALAEAWARSEADDTIDTGGPSAGSIHLSSGHVRNLTGVVLGNETGDGNTDQPMNAGSVPGPGGSSIGKGATGVSDLPHLGRMEEETEVDIRLARKRREANDRYFSKVNQGVIDVVSKLADVANTMRRVEAESKDIWGENESVNGTAK